MGERATNSTLTDRGLSRTVVKLRALGRHVVIVRPVPEVGYDVPSYAFSARMTGRDLNPIIAPKLQEYRDRTKEIDATFAKLEQRRLADFVDPTTYLCDSNICRVVADGIALYRDDDHLSTIGSRYIAPAFDPYFMTIVATAATQTRPAQLPRDAARGVRRQAEH